MTDLESRLRTAMEDEIRDTRAPSTLATDVVSRGTRARRRRRVAGGVSALVVLALAFPGWQRITAADSDRAPFVHPATATQPTSQRNAVHVPPGMDRTSSVSSWLATLATGTAPSVPYYSNRTMVAGGETYTFATQNVFGPVAGGLGRSDLGVATATYGIQAAQGGYTQLGQGSASGMASSPDGHQVAVGVQRGLRVYRDGSLEQTRATATPASNLVWFGNTLYFTTGDFGGGSAPTLYWAWHPGSAAAPHQVPAPIEANGTGIDQQPHCVRIVTASLSGRLTEGSCLNWPQRVLTYDVAPDGVHVAFAVEKPESTDQRLEVLDLVGGDSSPSGGSVTALTPWLHDNIASAPGPLWESNSAMLWVLPVSHAGQRATDAMVRCTISGDCSFAVAPLTASNDDFEPPLYLGPYFSY